jgi:hypothetical protein
MTYFLFFLTLLSTSVLAQVDAREKILVENLRSIHGVSWVSNIKLYKNDTSTLITTLKEIIDRPEEFLSLEDQSAAPLIRFNAINGIGYFATDRTDGKLSPGEEDYYRDLLEKSFQKKLAFNEKLSIYKSLYNTGTTEGMDLLHDAFKQEEDLELKFQLSEMFHHTLYGEPEMEITGDLVYAPKNKSLKHPISKNHKLELTAMLQYQLNILKGNVAKYNDAVLNHRLETLKQSDVQNFSQLEQNKQEHYSRSIASSTSQELTPPLIQKRTLSSLKNPPLTKSMRETEQHSHALKNSLLLLGILLLASLYFFRKKSE